MLSRGRALALSVLSGVALALSLPSFDLWPLAWVGLAPLLLAIRGRSPRGAFGVAWTGWFVFSAIVLYWIAPTISNYTSIGVALSSIALVLLCAISASFVGAFAALLEWLAAAGISRILAAPALWVSIEWLRTFFPAAFPWAFLGYSQLGALELIQIADVTAIYGVTALIVFVNASLVEVALDGVRRHVGLVATAAVLLALNAAYGFARLAQIRAREPIGHVPVGIAQGNVPQDQKWRPENQNATIERYLRLSRSAVDEGARVVVWPEAAVPFFLSSDPRAVRVARFTDQTRVWLLVGAPGYERRGGGVARQYNQAWMVVPGAGLEGPYDKMMLVPFGEYVPFGGMFGWVEQAVESVGAFGRGERPIVFEGPEVETRNGMLSVGLAPLICYEGIFPDLVRRFVAEGAEILVNISNDAWYGRTSAPHQHLAMAAVRAIENRVPLVRSTNTGISAVVDPTGEIRRATPLFEEAFFVHDVPIYEGGSVYTRIGDLFVYACVLASTGLLLLRLRLGAVTIRG